MPVNDYRNLSSPRLVRRCGTQPSCAIVETLATVYSRTLQRASEVLGGPQALADYLHVDVAELRRWIDARSQPPLDVFLRAVDIVVLHADRPRGNA
jgi:hypothetical protein